jgi:GGDEF domain-containing protein
VAQPQAVFFSQNETQPPQSLLDWIVARRFAPVVCSQRDALMAMALRARPAVVVFDARGQHTESVFAACRLLKSDSYTGVVPGAVLVSTGGAALDDAFDAGADEVLVPELDPGEFTTRLDAMLRRAERDIQVHPSTRLPGAPEIEAEIARRLAAAERFAACYADLDHFKEYNDRYGYFEGDRVIRILAKVLHDVVRGICPEQGFVGHIGGDDFLFIVPVEAAPEICQEIVQIFDTLVPYQYSEQDRHAGYFFGKDRRGQLHRVPLMTVSIGVVTNERRAFTHASQVSELATEMKSYAKTLTGSVYVVDRRQDPLVGAPIGAAER